MPDHPPELVERVTCAIRDADGVPWESPTYRDQARAALDAITETHEVIDEGEALSGRLAALERAVARVRELTKRGLRSGNSAAEDAMLARNALIRIAAALDEATARDE